MNNFRRNLYIFGGIVIIAVFSALILWKIPQWQSDSYLKKFTPEETQQLKIKDRAQVEKNAADIENNSRTTLSQIIGGLAVLIGLYFTYLNTKTARESLDAAKREKIGELFKKAIKNLESDKSNIVSDAISDLENIALDSPKDQLKIMEILTDFVRRKAPLNLSEEENLQEQKKSKPREDIKKIIKVIGRRRWSYMEAQPLNLQEVNLTGYDLTNTDLINLNLSGANLSLANLKYANLSRTNLSRANLNGANLSNANLNEADLSQANLNEANLSEAILNKANLTEADLQTTLYITLEQVQSARHFKELRLPPELKKEFEAWRDKENKSSEELLKKIAQLYASGKTKNTKEKTGAGEDSSEK